MRAAKLGIGAGAIGARCRWYQGLIIQQTSFFNPEEIGRATRKEESIDEALADLTSL